MCRTKMAADVAEVESTPPLTPSSPSKLSDAKSSPSSPCKDSTFLTSNFTNNSISHSTWTSISSLPESPHIVFDFSEINAATNNFLNKRYSAASWRCTLHGKDVIIFQRKFQRRIDLQDFTDRFHKICRSHHTSIIELLGASISGEYLYLIYNFVNGANLTDCLRNSRSPNFTILSTWISRMQIATDLAHGLDYIHNKSGLNISLMHNHITSSSIIVTEPSFNARICHFGAAQLCNEDDYWNERVEKPSKSKRSVQIKGIRGYMAPEYKSSGVATPMTDVYAFGVVILELLSGEEPLKFEFVRRKEDFVRVSLIETAMAVIEDGDDRLALEARLRRWVDRRLKDSFPIHVAEKVTRLAIQCVDVDPTKRPNMAHVACKISKMYLQSRIWSNNMIIPANLSVSLAPR